MGLEGGGGRVNWEEGGFWVEQEEVRLVGWGGRQVEAEHVVWPGRRRFPGEVGGLPLPHQTCVPGCVSGGGLGQQWASPRTASLASSRHLSLGGSSLT